MKILIHRASVTDFNSTLQDIVTSAVSKEEVSFTHEIDAFTESLLKYRIEQPIVIIQVSSITDIASVKTVQDLFDDLFLIIASSDTNAALLKSCRQLYPRLLVSNEKDYELIDGVIRKYCDIRKS